MLHPGPRLLPATALVLSLAAAAGCDDLSDLRVCNDIGCSDELRIELQGAEPKEFILEAVSGAGDTVIVQCPEATGFAERLGDCSYEPPEVVLHNFAPDEVMVRFFWDGRESVATFRPSYRLHRPNGPDCLPACRHGKVALSLSEYRCDSESYVLPDFIGMVDQTDMSHVRLVDVASPTYRMTPTPDTLVLGTFAATATFLRARDSSLVRADSAYPEIGDTVQFWYNGVELQSTLGTGYFATRVEIFKEFDPRLLTPVCDLESYILPDVIGTVSGLYERGHEMLLTDLIHPRGSGDPDETVLIVVPRATYLRARDSTLTRVYSTYPTVGETVQVWITNICLRSEPEICFGTRLEIFRGSG